jgi:hypothetical protein
MEESTSDFGNIFKNFLNSPNINKILDQGRRQIEIDRLRAEQERNTILHLNHLSEE